MNIYVCFFLFSPFPCSNISEMRKTYKDAFLKKHNMKLGFMSAFVKAAAYALSDQPAVNAGIDLTLKDLRSLTLWCQFDCAFARFVPSHWKCVWRRKRLKFRNLSVPNLKTTTNLYTALTPP